MGRDQAWCRWASSAEAAMGGSSACAAWLRQRQGPEPGRLATGKHPSPRGAGEAGGSAGPAHFRRGSAARNHGMGGRLGVQNRRHAPLSPPLHLASKSLKFSAPTTPNAALHQSDRPIKLSVDMLPASQTQPQGPLVNTQKCGRVLSESLKARLPWPVRRSPCSGLPADPCRPRWCSWNTSYASSTVQKDDWMATQASPAP